jgi:hypothetical protein
MRAKGDFKSEDFSPTLGGAVRQLVESGMICPSGEVAGMNPRSRKKGKAPTWSSSPSLMERLQVVAAVFNDPFPPQDTGRSWTARRRKAVAAERAELAAG